MGFEVADWYSKILVCTGFTLCTNNEWLCTYSGKALFLQVDIPGDKTATRCVTSRGEGS
jgi:hypothetical protein